MNDNRTLLLRSTTVSEGQQRRLTAVTNALQQQAYINLPLPVILSAGLTSLSVFLYKPCKDYYDRNKRNLLRKQIQLKRQLSTSLLLLNRLSTDPQRTKRQLSLFYKAQVSVYLRDIIAKLTLFVINLTVSKEDKSGTNGDDYQQYDTDLLSNNEVFGKIQQKQNNIIDSVSVDLDRIRDRAVAQLENERLASSSSEQQQLSDSDSDSTPSSPSSPSTTNKEVDKNEVYIINNEKYSSFTSLQRRELLSSTFDHRIAKEKRRSQIIQENQQQQQKRKTKTITLQNQTTPVKNNKKQSVKFSISKSIRNKKRSRNNNNLQTELTFWQTLENVNGRAAAIGFMLCLAREIIEPGHPSLFEQVIDVVVPIAQSTPPFLVAVCDRLADLLT